MIATRRGSDRDRAEAREVYARLGYRGGLEPADRLVVAEDGAGLVGLVRLAAEEGTTVLRGMRVLASHQRRGVGTDMLRAVAEELAGGPCWGIAYAHLKSFYARIGFREASAHETPTFLAERLARYRRERPDAALYVMFRPAGGAEGR
jgi:predicted N-acetyltransferase YhbS